MLKDFVKKIKLRFFTKADIGVSFDSSVKLKEMPVEDLNTKSAFYKLNNDLGVFEVTKFSTNPNLVCLIEIGTDNEIVVDRKVFDFLFSNLPLPKEIEF